MDEMPNGGGDDVAVRHLIEEWASAVRRRDLPAILRHHSPSLLMFDVPPPLRLQGLAQ